jgi:hypothetical protein
MTRKADKEDIHMKKQIVYYSVILLAVFISGTLGLPDKGSAAGPVDHSLFNDLLRIYVKNGEVSYAGFKKEEAKLDRYLALLEQTNVQQLPRDDQFAFYINAYNAWTIKLILSEYPGIESIWDLGNIIRTPWKKEICRLNGSVVSLDHIEHTVLRPTFKDPRVHFAINCASKGCPPLRPEAYEGNKLDQQLDDAARIFVNDPKYTRLDGKKLYVSKIFKWFDDDFNNDVFGFIMAYAEGALKAGLEGRREDVKIKYLDYDWALNGR